MTRNISITFVCTLLLGLATAPAADWPMMGRDNSRNAVSPEKNALVHWGLALRKGGVLVRPAHNIKWEATLGSRSFGSPVVAGGLVWIGTNNNRPRDPKVKEDAAVLMCFREADGQFLWQYVSPRLKNNYQDWSGASLNNSPLVEGDRLTFTTNRAEVVCLDIAPLRKGQGEPRLLWKLDMLKDLHVSPVAPAMNLGFTCSIGASYKGRIYVTTGNGVGEDDKTVPAPQAPSLVCLDQNTGKVLWSDNSPGGNIMHSQWSSALLARVQGRAQIIAAQGDGWIRSFDPLTGKLLWKFDGNPKKVGPYKMDGRSERAFFIATPVLYDNKVYIGVGQEADHGGGVGHLWCIDITRQPKNKDLDLSPIGDNFDPKAPVNKDSGLVWHYGGNVMPPPRAEDREVVFGRTMSTVAIHDGLVIAPELDGYVHCLDARTGRPQWVHDARDGIHASPLVVDNKVYMPTAGGTVVVLALSRTLRVLAEHDQDNVGSTPVFANGVLYLVDGWKLVAIQTPPGKERDRAPGFWPQWRGPERSNQVKEPGLLKAWPRKGPPLAWKTEGLGEGAASVAVAGGRVYTLGYRGEDEYITALEEGSGKKAWSVRIGPAVKENGVMRWLGQRTPTVDDDHLYAVTARGELICLKTRDGQEVWRKSYGKDFDGRAYAWGYSDRPLVDGKALICAPGGNTATVLALNKLTGEVLWKCPLEKNLGASYAATVASDVAGLRQYIVFLHGAVVGVSARDGKLLWRYDRVVNGTGNNYTPIVLDGHVLLASGYGKGLALLKFHKENEGIRAEEVYYKAMNLPPWHEGTVVLGEHLYISAGNGFACVEWKTGTVIWQKRDGLGGSVNLACADRHLYLRSQQGKVGLVEATPKEYRLKGTLAIPGAVAKPGSTAPVVTGGRLFLRDDDVLFCYDVQEKATDEPVKPPMSVPPRPEENSAPPTDPARRPRREVDAVFVPTPQEVVERMLELAKIKRDEVVCDLGCGDGRILVTAARKYGCKAIGYELDPECVRMSRASAKKHAVEQQVVIEEKDLFTADLGKVDVVTLYLLPGMNKRLLPQLARLKPGARIVAHAFAIPGVPPDQTVIHACKEDELEHKIYVWTAPLKIPKPGS